ncbi:MAG: hypothetical protein RJB62_101 [Pseudomonadota bacterium]|jgi:hypothetical protein
MVNLILTYTLKPGVTKDQFENWVRSFDYPNMRGLKRVSSFKTYRTEKLLVGAGKPPADYVEIFAIDDFEGFLAEDMPGGVVQKVMGEFMGHVENPAFMIVSEVV